MHGTKSTPSITDLLSNDFRETKKRLLKLCKMSILDDMTSQILNATLEPSEILRIREHVFHLIGGRPLFFALEVDSPEILSWINGCQDETQIVAAMIEYLRDELRSEHPRLVNDGIELRVLSQSDYVILAPEILKAREHEMESCRIFYSETPVSKYKIRYSLVELWRTSYGRRILTSAGFSIQDRVVGSKTWKKIVDLFSRIDIDLNDRLVEIDPDKWTEFVLFQMADEKPPSSMEVSVIRPLRYTWESLLSSDPKRVCTAMRDLREYRLGVCNPEVRRFLGHANRAIVEETLKLLLVTEGASIGPTLEEFVRMDETPHRALYAHALSRLVSQEFVERIDQTREVEKRLRKLQKGPIITGSAIAALFRDLLIDSTDSLTLQGDTWDHMQLLQRFLSSANAEQKLSLLRMVPLMEHGWPQKIINALLNDPSPSVRMAALQLADEYGSLVSGI